MRRVAGIFALILCFTLLTGFTIPSPHELRREFREELQKIKESTPGAKALAHWKELKARAKQALLDAEINMAPKLASDRYEEAADLFQRAKRYAVKKSYKKASYLAKKTIEVATAAKEEAVKEIAHRKKGLERKIKHIKAKLDQLQERLTYGSGYSASLADLYLQWSDIRHAISLGKFDEAEKETAALENSVRDFIKQTGISLDSGQEKWEETI